ncbi:MAG TPA: hypothetical protein VFX49_04770, partial [Chloroflexota bacterium]|nr:hypothetical protein [Chloroflexota bacterium]
MSARRVLLTAGLLALVCALPLRTPPAAGQTIPLRPTPTPNPGAFSVLVQPTPPAPAARPVGLLPTTPAAAPGTGTSLSPSPSPQPAPPAAAPPATPPEPFRIEHLHLSPGQLPAPPAGWRLAESALRVSGTAPSNPTSPGANLTVGGTVTVALSARDLAAAGGRAAGLAVFALDAGAWVRVPTQTLDPAAGRLTFVAPGPGTYAVLAAALLPDRDDYAVPGGRFFRTGAAGGFAVLDGLGGPPAAFWTVYTAVGGEPALGRPISRRFSAGGQLYQVFERGAISSAAGRAATARAGEPGLSIPDPAREPEPPPLPPIQPG